MYMVCSVPIPTSFPNIAQGRKTHSKGVLIMASPRDNVGRADIVVALELRRGPSRATHT
jgi:hypothetical protein